MNSLHPTYSDILSLKSPGKIDFMGETVLAIPRGQNDLSNVLCSNPRRPTVPSYLTQKAVF